MNKAIKTGAAVLGVLLAAALVVFIFFPGLPTYIKVRREFDDIDRHVPEFTKLEVPSDFVKHSKKNVEFSTPAGWSATTEVEGYEPSSYRSDDKSMILVTVYDQGYYDILDNNTVDGLDPWSAYDHSEEEFRHFFDKLGLDYPDKWLSTWLIWLARDGFTSKDCLKLRGTDLSVFEELADIKEGSGDVENYWKLSGIGEAAYIGQVKGFGYDGGIWTYSILPENSEDMVLVTVKCSDETVAKQIISSVRLK